MIEDGTREQLVLEEQSAISTLNSLKESSHEIKHERYCSLCLSHESPVWRSNKEEKPSKDEYLCNTCGLSYQKFYHQLYGKVIYFFIEFNCERSKLPFRERLAKNLGLELSTLSQIERQVFGFTFEDLQEIAETLEKMRTLYQRAKHGLDTEKLAAHVRFITENVEESLLQKLQNFNALQGSAITKQIRVVAQVVHEGKLFLQERSPELPSSSMPIKGNYYEKQNRWVYWTPPSVESIHSQKLPTQKEVHTELKPDKRMSIDSLLN